MLEDTIPLDVFTDTAVLGGNYTLEQLADFAVELITKVMAGVVLIVLAVREFHGEINAYRGYRRAGGGNGIRPGSTP